MLILFNYILFHQLKDWNTNVRYVLQHILPLQDWMIIWRRNMMLTLLWQKVSSFVTFKIQKKNKSPRVVANVSKLPKSLCFTWAKCIKWSRGYVKCVKRDSKKDKIINITWWRTMKLDPRLLFVTFVRFQKCLKTQDNCTLIGHFILVDDSCALTVDTRPVLRRI